MKNWSILLFDDEKELRSNSRLKKDLKKLFELKANGSEKEYIYGLQRSAALKKMIERTLNEPSCIATMMLLLRRTLVLSVILLSNQVNVT